MVKYLYCDKCGGYYVLNLGESPDEFSDKCECGGHLLLGEMGEKTAEDQHEEELIKLANKQVSEERNKELLSYLRSIDFFSSIAIGGVLGFFTIFLISIGSFLTVFMMSSFITSLIIKRNANIPSLIIPKIINNNPKFRRVYAGTITSIIIGGLVGLGMNAMQVGQTGVSSSTFLTQVILGIIFFMIIGLILGIFGGFIGVFVRDLMSKIKSPYFPSENPSEENDITSHDIVENGPNQKNSSNSKEIKTPKTRFWKKFSSLQKLLIVFAVIFILLLGYASLTGFFEPKSHYNGKGVSFDYPSKYVVDISPNINDTSDLKFLKNTVTFALDNKDNLGFVVYKLNPSIGKDAMINTVSMMATSDNGIIVSQNDIKVDNTDGHEVISSYKGIKKVPTTKFVYFTKNNIDYVIIFYSNNLEKIQSDTNMIINSFHVS